MENINGQIIGYEILVASQRGELKQVLKGKTLEQMGKMIFQVDFSYQREHDDQLQQKLRLLANNMKRLRNMYWLGLAPELQGEGLVSRWCSKITKIFKFNSKPNSSQEKQKQKQDEESQPMKKPRTKAQRMLNKLKYKKYRLQKLKEKNSHLVSINSKQKQS